MKKKLFYLLSATILLACCKPATTQNVQSCDFIKGFVPNNQVTCGKISVPENHQNPKGKKIQIAYVVLKAKEKVPGRYPVMYLSGGPGGKSIMQRAIQFWLQTPMRNQQDLILIDQRGIGHSSGLPDMSDDIFKVLAKNASETEERKLTVEVIKKYQAICQQKNIELKNYNTYQNAQDVGKLMAHLAYDKYNLYGSSYGTRLARMVEDLFPQQLNSVVLDSPAPMTRNFLLGRLDSYTKALGRVFKYWKTKGKHLTLKKDYLEVINSLKTKPLKITFRKEPFYVNAQDAILLLRRVMYRSNSRQLVPELIQAYKKGNGKLIEQAIMQEFQLGKFVNLSMLLAVEKHESFDPRHTSVSINKYYQKFDLLPAKLGFFDALYQAGKKWHAASVPIDKRKFKMSAVPTLILANQYDPVTPPSYGREFKERLSNARLLILDEGGHGGGNPECKTRVVMKFMGAPKAKLDTSCLHLYKEK